MFILQFSLLDYFLSHSVLVVYVVFKLIKLQTTTTSVVMAMNSAQFNCYNLLIEAWLFWSNAKTLNEIMMWYLIPVGIFCFLFTPFSLSFSRTLQQGELNHAHCTTLRNIVYLMLMASSGVKQKALSENVSYHTQFILRNINSQSELFASSDVEAQTAVIWGGEEMDDPAESAVWTGLRWCATTLLNHHPPVN